MSIYSDVKRFSHLVSYKLTGTTAVMQMLESKYYSCISPNCGKIKPKINISKLDFSMTDEKVMCYLKQMYLKHRYDLLGSGWIKAGFDAQVLGMEGYFYQNQNYVKDTDEYFKELKQAVSAKVFRQSLNIKEKISRDYEAICWNRDYKSGYMWKAEVLDMNKSIQTPEGADVKTVWELGRLQFLVQLALTALHKPQDRMTCIQEYKDVILDFISANPVGVGVQWISPMDAAIRITNMLLAFDIFSQIDENHKLNHEFQDLLAVSTYQHGRYIFDNLEKDIFHGRNRNHYYSNLVGLLYASSYLSDCKSSKRWYRFAKTEFIKETEKQFNADGSNIEASTSYHKLMHEMLVFGSAVLLREEHRIPDIIEEKLYRATCFLEKITKEDGRIIQIGDNDSGRFVKAVSYGSFMSSKEAEKKYLNLQGYTKIYSAEEQYFDEDALNSLSALQYANGLYRKETIEDSESHHSVECSLIQAIANSTLSQKPNHKHGVLERQSDQGMSAGQQLEDEFAYAVTTVFERRKYHSGDIVDGNKVENDRNEWGYFPDFGLYFKKEEGLELYVYTGGKNCENRAGHSHNDIMHCELVLDGKNILSDSGTYVYTAFPVKRDTFRGRKAHFVPDYGIETRKFKGGFGYTGSEKSRIIGLLDNSIKIRYEAEGIIHQRNVKVENSRIVIEDRGTKPFKIGSGRYQYYSEGYGKLEKQGIESEC